MHFMVDPKASVVSVQIMIIRVITDTYIGLIQVDLFSIMKNADFQHQVALAYDSTCRSEVVYRAHM